MTNVYTVFHTKRRPGDMDKSDIYTIQPYRSTAIYDMQQSGEWKPLSHVTPLLAQYPETKLIKLEME